MTDSLGRGRFAAGGTFGAAALALLVAALARSSTPLPAALAFLSACAGATALGLPTVRAQLAGAVTPARLRDARFAVAAVFVAGLALYPVLNGALELLGVTYGPRLVDFGAYYNAARRVAVGAPLYAPTPVDGHYAVFSSEMPYLYPPVYVAAFLPFTLLPPVAAGVAFNVISLCLLCAGVVSLARTYGVATSRWQAALACYLVVGYAPTVTWLKLGQVSGALAGLLCLSAARLRTSGGTGSGTLTVVAGAVKPFYAPVGAHLLHNRTRFLGAVLAGGGMLGLGLLVFGVDVHLDYLDVLAGGKGWGEGGPPQAWHATVFDPFHVLGRGQLAAQAALVALTLGLTVASVGTGARPGDVFALGAVTVPLVGPSTNVLALNALVPAIMILALGAYERSGVVPLPLLVATTLVQVHPYTVEGVAKFGPRYVPALEGVAPALPYLQPALWGCLLLFGFAAGRVVAGARGTDAVDASGVDA